VHLQWYVALALAPGAWRKHRRLRTFYRDTRIGQLNTKAGFPQRRRSELYNEMDFQRAVMA